MASSTETTRLISKSNSLLPISRVFDCLPTVDSAAALLKEVNQRSPAKRLIDLADKPLILYGAGNLGKLARDHLCLVNQPIALIVDADAPSLRNRIEWQGFRVEHPDDMPKGIREGARLAISIANSPFIPIRDHLADRGWGDIVPFYDIAELFRDRHPLSNGWFASKMNKSELVIARDILSRLADDISRAHYLQFAAWRLAREEWSFRKAPVIPANRFFTSEVISCFRGDERLLDVGAHHGGVAARMLQECPDTLKRCWLVEPDEANLGVLRSWLGRLEVDARARFEVIDAVVGGGESIVRFHSGLGYASQIASTGQVDRLCVTVDSLNVDPTYVKLHLEGCELNALKGSIRTIQRFRPIVATTIYHNSDGLIFTPLWLMENLSDYSFLLRNHSWCGTGAVIYALPNERR